MANATKFGDNVNIAKSQARAHAYNSNTQWAGIGDCGCPPGHIANSRPAWVLWEETVSKARGGGSTH